MPIALVAAGIGAAGAIGSALIGASAAKEASNTQAKAAQNALDFQKQTYADQQKNFQPYLDIGKGATYKLASLTGTGSNSSPDFSQFYVSPDYKFRQQQGELGIERAANARGMNLSGGTLKDLASFNSGLASTEFGNYFDRLMNLSKLGANSAAASGQNSATMSSTIGNTTIGLGQAQASGTIGAANATMGGINSATNNALLAAYLGKNQSAYGGNNLASSMYGGNGNPLNITGSLY